MKKQGVVGEEKDQPKPFSDKVDLNDLEWEDRERVLRLLFSKMNTGVSNQQMKQQVRQQQKRDI